MVNFIFYILDREIISRLLITNVNNPRRWNLLQALKILIES